MRFANPFRSPTDLMPSLRGVVALLIVAALSAVAGPLAVSAAAETSDGGLTPVADGGTAGGENGGLTPASGDGRDTAADGTAPRYAAIGVQSSVVAGRSLDGAACGFSSGPAQSITAGEPATFCYYVSNLGTARLDQLRISDARLGLVDAAVPSVGAGAVLEPGGLIVLFHHTTAARRSGADATVVTGRPIDGLGAPIAGLASPAAQSAPGAVSAGAEEPAETGVAAPTDLPAEPEIEAQPAPAPELEVAGAAVGGPSAGGASTASAGAPAAAPSPSPAPAPAPAPANMAGDAAAVERAAASPIEPPVSAAAAPAAPAGEPGLAVHAAIAAPAGTSGAPDQLAYTGPSTEVWILAVFGTALVFFGYTIMEAFRRPMSPAGALAGHAQLDALGFDDLQTTERASHRSMRRTTRVIRPTAARRRGGRRAR